jgi:hypothetical protein
MMMERNSDLGEEMIVFIPDLASSVVWHEARDLHVTISHECYCDSLVPRCVVTATLMGPSASSAASADNCTDLTCSQSCAQWASGLYTDMRQVSVGTGSSWMGGTWDAFTLQVCYCRGMRLWPIWKSLGERIGIVSCKTHGRL